jgi:hypothetical protein
LNPGFQSKPWAGISERFQRYSSHVEFSHTLGVTPSVETVGIFTLAVLMNFPSQTANSRSKSRAAGKAEASSAGEQLAKE